MSIEKAMIRKTLQPWKITGEENVGYLLYFGFSFAHHLTDILVLYESCRKVDQATYPLLKKKVFGKKEICKTTKKVCYIAYVPSVYFLIGLYYQSIIFCVFICICMDQVMTVADKCFNGKTVSAGTRVKYTKPKLTNPKPFRLRTDV